MALVLSLSCCGSLAVLKPPSLAYSQITAFPVAFQQTLLNKLEWLLLLAVPEAQSWDQGPPGRVEGQGSVRAGVPRA